LSFSFPDKNRDFLQIGPKSPQSALGTLSPSFSGHAAPMALGPAVGNSFTAIFANIRHKNKLELKTQNSKVEVNNISFVL
jgi:hypothetical protein